MLEMRREEWERYQEIAKAKGIPSVITGKAPAFYAAQAPQSLRLDAAVERLRNAATLGAALGTWVVDEHVVAAVKLFPFIVRAYNAGAATYEHVADI
jgi:hypothetical protein